VKSSSTEPCIVRIRGSAEAFEWTFAVFLSAPLKRLVSTLRVRAAEPPGGIGWDGLSTAVHPHCGFTLSMINGVPPVFLTVKVWRTTVPRTTDPHS
jgi:hypothetical protein